MKDLFKAIEKGNLDKVKTEVKKINDLNDRRSYITEYHLFCDTPLSYAIHSLSISKNTCDERIKIIDFLVTVGADVNQFSDGNFFYIGGKIHFHIYDYYYQKFPLIEIVEKIQPKYIISLIKLLIKNDVNLDLTNNERFYNYKTKKIEEIRRYDVFDAIKLKIDISEENCHYKEVFQLLKNKKESILPEKKLSNCSVNEQQKIAQDKECSN